MVSLLHDTALACEQSNSPISAASLFLPTVSPEMDAHNPQEAPEVGEKLDADAAEGPRQFVQVKFGNYDDHRHQCSEPDFKLLSRIDD